MKVGTRVDIFKTGTNFLPLYRQVAAYSDHAEKVEGDEMGLK